MVVLVLHIDFPEHVFDVEVGDFADDGEELFVDFVFLDELHEFLFGDGLLLLLGRGELVGEGLLEMGLVGNLFEGLAGLGFDDFGDLGLLLELQLVFVGSLVLA